MSITSENYFKFPVDKKIYLKYTGFHLTKKEGNLGAPEDNFKDFKEEITQITSDVKEAAEKATKAAKEATKAAKGVKRVLITTKPLVDYALIATLIVMPLYYSLFRVIKRDIDVNRFNRASTVIFQKQSQDEFDQLVSTALKYAKQHYKPNLTLGDQFVESRAKGKLAKYCEGIILLLGKKEEEKAKKTPDYYLFMGLHYCGIAAEHVDFPINAKENFEKYLELHPLDEEVWVNLGLVYEVSGDLKKAIKTYDEALKCNKAYCRARYNKALALFRNGSQDKAMNEVDMLIERLPDCSEAYFTKALLSYNIGEVGDADRLLKEAFERNFSDLNWLVNTGFLDDAYRRQSETYKYVVKKLAEANYLDKEEIRDLLNI